MRFRSAVHDRPARRADRRRSRSAPSTPAWIGRALAAAAMLAAAWAWRARAEPRNPALGMDLERAYAEAGRLVGERRHTESLPYFDRMLELAPDEWSLHHDYANALQGASLEGREVLGLRLRATRSSLEAIELMRRALAEMDRAQALARSPRDLATVHLARARQFGVWGFPCDALFESRAAASADPSWDEAAAAVAEWTRRLGRETRQAASAAAR